MRSPKHNTGTIENPAPIVILAEKPSRHCRIQAEQIRLLEKQVPGSTLGMLAGTMLLAFLLRNQDVPINIYFWMGMAFSCAFALAAQWVVYRRTPVITERVTAFAIPLILIGLITGCSWGSAGFLLFVSGSLEHQLFLVMMLIIGAGATSIATMAYRPVFLAIFIPFLLPLIVRLVIEGDTTHLALGFTVFVYAIVIAISSLNNNHTLSASLNLRFENAELVSGMKDRTEEAERANLAKSRFLAAASHDLRQPLHALGLFVGVLEDRIQYPDVRKLVKNIRSSVDVLDGLFNALLDISKLDAGVLTADLQTVSVSRLLERMKIDYSPRAMEKGVTFRVIPCDIEIHSDPILLDRLVRNLVSNAVNNTSTGTVLLSSRCRKDHVQIEVRDSGIGIPEERLQDIFEEFYQIGNSERDRRKGLGLGLAIADRITRFLGYKIDVSSTPGKGSVFTVTVPITTGVGDKPSAPAPLEQISPDLAGHFVAVIEDDVEVLEAMQLLLTDWGCQVLAASTAPQIICELADTEKYPDVIVADYRLMDNTTGVQAINEIRTALNMDIPGILITGDTAPDRLRDAEASGYPLLHKPVPPARLRALLSYTLQRKERTDL